MNKIPKIIHYCWFGSNPLPELAEKCIASWKKYCPDYEIIRWDETNFDINCNQYVKEAYESKKWAFVTDYVRLYVIYEHGGIYLDTDVELLKSFDDLLKYSGFFGFENLECIATGLGFGSSKHNKIVYEILNDYENISFIKEDGSFDLTPCPKRNTKVLVNNGLIKNNTMQIINDVVFLPIEYLNPLDHETGKLVITDITYSIHHFNSSWYTEEQRKKHIQEMKFRKIFGKKIGGRLLNLQYVLNNYGYIETFKIIIRKLKVF